MALALYCDIEDLTPPEMPGMTVLLDMVTTAKIKDDCLISSISKLSFAVKPCLRNFRLRVLMRIDKTFFLACLVQLTVLPVIFPIKLRLLSV